MRVSDKVKLFWEQPQLCYAGFYVYVIIFYRGVALKSALHSSIFLLIFIFTFLFSFLHETFYLIQLHVNFVHQLDQRHSQRIQLEANMYVLGWILISQKTFQSFKNVRQNLSISFFNRIIIIDGSIILLFSNYRYRFENKYFKGILLSVTPTNLI